METPDLQIKRIVLDRMARCSVCHHSFVPDDIHVISRKSDMWMMVVECSECQGRNFVAAVLNDGDPGEAQLALRRLSESGVKDHTGGLQPSPALPKVSTDDVLDMHEFLADFDGDFQRLFVRG
ncbi:MAG: hypothetical protein M3R02_29905 [Chloroflexota bacterium]|nr:hypothetical protein [Chloroflexota bacterium]